MVAAVRGGMSMRAAARKFSVGLSTVRLWVKRAKGNRLDRMNWGDGASGSRPPRNRLPSCIENLILCLRRELKEESPLGEYGAAAIHRELLQRGISAVPAIRTIGRVLERRGVLDANRRVRRLAPPPGWYLPELAAGRAELDSFDIVEGLVIAKGPRVEVLNAVSLHGGLVASWPEPRTITTDKALTALVEHWRAFGLPDYAQFDNDTVFQGPHQHADAFGRVVRLCMKLGIVPVFAPPRETGFQAAIENFNGRWQTKVWGRFHHDTFDDLLAHSNAYVDAYRRRNAKRTEAAPDRRPFPKRWRMNLTSIPLGCMIFIRRLNDRGVANFLGHYFEVDPLWANRLTRCELNLRAERIAFYALRRRDPGSQPLLKEILYSLPSRRPNK